MEYKDKITIAIAVVSVAAISFLFAEQYRSRRLRRQKCITRSSCYLHTDQKPQCSFKRVLADNSFSQFKHLKLHDDSSNSHPYEKEIIALIESAGIEFGFGGSYGMELKEMNDNYIWVEIEDQLKELVNKLCKEKAIAVDTEQHSLRSFLGFTALIQISTRNEDYLLDAIALHDVMGILGPVFADPGICKVFHGADNDVLWLQRDFHIYVVNLFDTAKACELLSKPQKSLAYLLETYCSVSTNKLLQREDWRHRPLSAEMLQYAQTDAHYLLYIASCLIAELKQQNNDNSSSCPDDKLNFVLEASRRSNMICLQLYTKEVEEFPGDSAASSLLSRHLNGHGGSSVSCEIQDLVRRLCTWRELMARVHDESLRYVLSDQSIASIAEKGPTNSKEIYDAIAQANVNMDPPNFVSLGTPSPMVCSHFNDFCFLIQDNKSNLEDIFSLLLQKCLGPNGSCPLSIYNYGLLVNSDLRLTIKSVLKKNGDKNSKQFARKALRSRELFVQKFSCKSPVYHNCRIYANDGRLLCYCDQRKLEWYLLRDLAKIVDENPPAIMLLFEPKGRPEDEDNDFYIQSKKNICVGCGEGRHYLRYRIIPSCYRMHFPEHLKSHRSHDIVLLCVDCHEVAHAAAEKYKRHVAVEFGIPLFVHKVVDSKEIPVSPAPSSPLMSAEQEGVSPLQLRTAAMALLRHGPKMPPKRREELTQIVTQYYGGREISQEDLERALLVGMSPHERRRFEKKRGLSLKQPAMDILARNELVHDVSITKSSKAAVIVPPTGVKEGQETLNMTNCDICICSNNIQVAGASTTAYNDMNSNGNEISTGNDGDTCAVSPNRLVGLNYSPHDGNGLPNNNSKLSLLGHGPHGKQVVEYLLKEYGEDGIREFCQRWRQVFVEAVHPRFLPAGWDVMHSGRRDFGEFSVYNPANRSASGAN